VGYDVRLSGGETVRYPATTETAVGFPDGDAQHIYYDYLVECESGALLLWHGSHTMRLLDEKRVYSMDHVKDYREWNSLMLKHIYAPGEWREVSWVSEEE
jgi:hypothetical protein